MAAAADALAVEVAMEASGPGRAGEDRNRRSGITRVVTGLHSPGVRAIQPGMDRHALNPSRIGDALRAPSGGSSDFELNPGFSPAPGRRVRAASVLVPLVERGARLRVILTRRAALLRHHPGQVAFPGGKQDPEDPTPLAAALREAREEIGLDGVDILGELPPHETVTGFVVTPFVGLVAPDFAPRIDRREVDEVFEVPLDFLLDPANYRLEGRAWQGHIRQYYVVPWGPHYIWGATARMLRMLADRMQAE